MKAESDRLRDEFRVYHLNLRPFNLRGVVSVPIAYTISVFGLGYLLMLGLSGSVALQFGVLLTLIISSTALTLALTIVTIHYWVTWKIEMEKLRRPPAVRAAINQ